MREDLRERLARSFAEPGIEAAGRRILFQHTVPSPSGEQVSSCGRCSLEQLGRDLVQEKLVATLDAVLHG